MNRLLLTAAAFVTFALSGLLARPAAAQYPGRTVVVAQPTVIVNNGATYGYGAGYGTAGYSSPGYNNDGYSNYSYGANSGYATPYRLPASAPYGAGYSGGWQPYQQMYSQRLYYGLGF